MTIIICQKESCEYYCKDTGYCNQKTVRMGEHSLDGWPTCQDADY
jgi:hypothetical protein